MCAGDRRLDLCLLALGTLEIGAGANVARGEVAQSVPLTDEIVLPREKLCEVRLGGAPVEPCQHRARLHRLSLAAAKLDNPRLYQRRLVGPGHRLDDARRSDGLRSVAALQQVDLRLPRRRVERSGAGAGRQDTENGEDAD